MVEFDLVYIKFAKGVITFAVDVFRGRRDFHQAGVGREPRPPDPNVSITIGLRLCRLRHGRQVRLMVLYVVGLQTIQCGSVEDAIAVETTSR